MSAISIKKVEQPAIFSFTKENEKKIPDIIAKYPKGREQSAVMPLLWMAQKQNNNWLPQAAIELVAKICNMPVIRVHEVASFYSMFNLAPVGEHFIQCCTTTPCWLAGSDKVVQACKDVLGIEVGETTRDGKFTLREVECLGACANAPMIQVDGHDASEIFYEDLTYESTKEILKQLKRGETPKVGSQTGRNRSEPLGERLTLVGGAATAEKPKAEESKVEKPKAAKPKAAKTSKPKTEKPKK